MTPMLFEQAKFAAPPTAPLLPAPALKALAGHSRAAGLGLLLLDAQGQILFHDAAAPALHLQYSVPVFSRARDNTMLRAQLARLRAAPAQAIWDFIPGLLVAALPQFQRRQMTCVLILAAKSATFTPDTIAEAAVRLGLDPQTLLPHAAELETYTPARLKLTASLLQDVLSDRTRASVLESELNSLSTQLANAYEELALIEQISGGMRINRAPADFFRHACEEIMQVISVRGMGVLVRPDKQHAPAAYGEIKLSADDLARLSDLLLPALRQRQSWVMVSDIPADPAFKWLPARQLIAVPLQRGDQVHGCIFAIDKQNAEFDSVDAKLLTSIANESAMYFENALLFGNLHELMMGLLHSLTSAVDAKDAYTCGHSERVALIARHAATLIGLSDAEAERVYMGGLLHDVGKIGVPESVLQKTGRLTPEEFELIKKHPLIGARILSDVKQLGDIVPGVMHHHERFDGRGYPAALAGRDIPVMGRIICLADCFDAMTSSRTYRKALPLEVALAEIRRCSGTQFDPALAEAFLRVQPDRFRLLLRDHQQQAKRLLELQESLRAA